MGNTDSTETANDGKNWMSSLSDDLIISIITYNISTETTIKMMLNFKSINKQFYHALNPNNERINIIWRQICLNTFPYHVHNTLKMKRWDQYLRYKVMKIEVHRDKDEDYKLFSDLDRNDSVIINCENDIEDINNLHSKVFKDQIGDNGLPDDYEWKLQCPVLSDKLKYIDDTTKYCTVCKKNVYQVHNVKDLKEKVANKECVSMVIYSGLDYFPKRVRGKVMPLRYRRATDKDDPHKKLRNNRNYRHTPAMVAWGW